MQRIEIIFTSDLIRAVQTAEQIAKNFGISILKDSRIREAHLGHAQGLTFEEIEHRFGTPLLKKWKSNHPENLNAKYPEGETGMDVLSRTFDALEDFVLKTSYQRIGVSSHGGVIRRVISHLLQSPDIHIPIPNCILYCLDYHLTSKNGPSPPT